MDTLSQAMVRAVREDDEQRLRSYLEAWRAYHGEWPKPLKVKGTTRRGGQLDPAVPYEGAGADDNVLLGWAAEIVDTTVSYLFGQDVHLDVGDDPDADDEPERWLAEVLDASGGMTLLAKAATNGAVCGHVVLMVQPREPGDATYYRNNPRAVRIVNLDPANVRAIISSDDPEQAEGWVVEWLAVDAADQALLRRRRVTQVAPSGAPGTGAWMVTDEQAPADQPEAYRERTPAVVWPFRWAPIFACQNLPLPNEHYGLADLDRTTLDLIAAANRRASDLARTLRMHAHPQPYVKGLTPAQAAIIELGIDRLIGLPGQPGDTELGMLELKNDSPSMSLDYVRWLQDQVRQHSRTPEASSGHLEDVGSLSGVAIELLFQPLMAKTLSKRRTYGRLLVDLGTALLELAGWTDPGPVAVRWPAILPGDPQADAEVAMARQAAGVSRTTTLAELGYDPEVEAERNAATTEADTRTFLAGGA